MAGIPGQIIEIGAGGGGWLVPWVKEKETLLNFSDLKTADNCFPSIPAAEQPDQEKDFFYPRLGWQDHQRPRVPELGEHVAAVAAASCLLLMLTVG